MPDWITHLGATYVATQATVRLRPGLARWVDLRWVLVGALLPDVSRFTVILVDGLDWPAIPTFTYAIPFHSLLITSLLAGALALLLPAGGQSSGRTFGLVLAGAVFHFLLDDLEGGIGCGSTTFYPVYFGKPFSVWSVEGHFPTLLLVVSAMALGAALARPPRGSLFRLRLTRARLLGSLALLAAAGLLPLLWQGWMIKANAYYLGFVANPAAFEGQPVELCFSEVLTAQPPVIEEFDRPFRLESPANLVPGEWVSVRGVYRQGVIRPVTLIHHQAFGDVSLSLVAVVGFLVLMFRSGGIQWICQKSNVVL